MGWIFEHSYLSRPVVVEWAVGFGVAEFVVEIGDGDHGPCGCWSGKVHRHSLCAFKSRVDTPPQIFQYYACHKFVFIVIQFSQILYSVFYLFIYLFFLWYIY